jgi:hypothetical protein
MASSAPTTRQSGSLDFGAFFIKVPVRPVSRDRGRAENLLLLSQRIESADRLNDQNRTAATVRHYGNSAFCAAFARHHPASTLRGILPTMPDHLLSGPP